MQLLTSLLLFFCLVAAVHSADRPNVIVIMVDDLGFSDIGCYGGEIEPPAKSAAKRQRKRKAAPKRPTPNTKNSS